MLMSIIINNYSYLNIIVAVVFVAKIVVDFGFESDVFKRQLPHKNYKLYCKWGGGYSYKKWSLKASDINGFRIFYKKPL